MSIPPRTCRVLLKFQWLSFGIIAFQFISQCKLAFYRQNAAYPHGCSQEVGETAGEMRSQSTVMVKFGMVGFLIYVGNEGGIRAA